tara:strand:- start:1286 stop:1588 length:303 start_codon:yes stop_codon:yes gene_type:complete
MAKKVKKAVKKTAKKVVKKVLDSTTIDEKIIENIDKNRSLYNLILCYVNCYGAYVTALGAGCLFGVNNWLALGLLAITVGWAWWATCKCKPCKGGEGTCC